ncbi:MAG: hypothetical protein H6934_04365 [Burkholderiaceae bacterium]|nr:hypothetical protein [Burkholderiaceae bacterium]
MRSRKAIGWVMALALLALAPQWVRAQQVVQIENKWRKTLIGADGKVLRQMPPGPGANPLATQWFVEPVGNSGLFRLRSALNGLYIDARSGPALVAAAPGAVSAIWAYEPVDGEFGRLRNHGQKHKYLHTQYIPSIVNGGTIQPGWHSAMWRLRALDATPAASPAGALPPPSAPASAAVAPLPPVPAPAPQMAAPMPPPAASVPAPTAPATAAPQTVDLVFQNASNSPLDVFVQENGADPAFAFTVPPMSQAVQKSPVGLVWRLAQGDAWLDAFQAGTEPQQVIRFPQ